ncbi:MAG: FGGY family carbohydrate kinase [Armatimonadota bacterium]|nr:FGGY family carbohydrate kinase [Armatimonadota bacterium]
MEKTILTLDLGTTAVKATLFTVDGVVCAQAMREYPTERPRPDWAEQDPEVWWEASVEAIRALGDLRSVKVISLTSQREGVVPVDAQGNPLARCIIWQDRRAYQEAQELASAFGEGLHARTGMRPDPTFTAPKLLWMRRHDPDSFTRARWFLQPRDYLYLRLTGCAVTDPSLASRTMLWDLRAGCWWEEGLSYVGLRNDQLPPVYPSTAMPGSLSVGAAHSLGVQPGIPVVVGAGDRACEAIGVGAADGRVMVSTGTTTNISTATVALPARLDPRLLYSAHGIPGWYLIEQGLSTSGSILRWLRDEVLGGQWTYADLDRLAAESPPGARGLILLPFFMGARSTRWNPHARGLFLGFTLGHRLGDLVRSVLEGVAMEIRACLDLLREGSVHVSEIVVVGGGARSSLWNQILADAAGCPVVVPKEREAASLGAMILAAAGMGYLGEISSSWKTLNPVVNLFTYREEIARFYENLYSLYNATYRAVEPLYESLAALDEEGR